MNADKIAINMDANITIEIIFLCLFLLDSSDNKK